MGTCSSSSNATYEYVDPDTRLQIYNKHGRKLSKHLAQAMLENILMGKPSYNHKAQGKISRTNLQLPVFQATMVMNSLIQGMSLHPWICMRELNLTNGYSDKELLECLYDAFGDSHRSLERLELSVEVGDDPTELRDPLFYQLESPWPSLAQLLQSQPKLKELDLSGSHFREDDEVNVKLFVNQAFCNHPMLKKIVMKDTILQDSILEVIFCGLGHGFEPRMELETQHNLLGSSHAASNTHSSLECLIINMAEPNRRPSHHMFGPAGTEALIKYLPHLGLQYVQFQDLILERQIEPLSFSYWVDQIQYLDRMYQRFQILRDRIPSYLWPLLGYCKDDNCGEYFSKHQQVYNQLCFAGLSSYRDDLLLANHESGVCVVNWQATWTLQERESYSHYSTRPNWPELWTTYSQSLPSGVVLEEARQENSFRASALFGLLRQHVLVHGNVGFGIK